MKGIWVHIEPVCDILDMDFVMLDFLWYLAACLTSYACLVQILSPLGQYLHILGSYHSESQVTRDWALRLLVPQVQGCRWCSFGSEASRAEGNREGGFRAGLGSGLGRGKVGEGEDEEKKRKKIVRWQLAREWVWTWLALNISFRAGVGGSLGHSRLG